LNETKRMSSKWVWTLAATSMLMLSGCGMYPAHPGMWPGGIWGEVLQFVSHILDIFAGAVGHSYGIALLFLTVLVRLLITPFYVKQIRYSKVMQSMQPEIAKIRAQNKGDNQKIQAETMKLWKREGVNPMAGCLPTLLQLPVLYSLFGAIEGNVGLSHSIFLGIFNLGKPDHYYILPILAAITTYFSSKLTMMGVDKQQKTMLLIMPVFIFIIALRFPSGLALYWVYGNAFTTIQTYFVRVRPAKSDALKIDVAQKPSKRGSSK